MTFRVVIWHMRTISPTLVSAGRRHVFAGQTARPQQDSNLCTRPRSALPCTASTCGNVIVAVAWGAYGGRRIMGCLCLVCVHLPRCRARRRRSRARPGCARARFRAEDGPRSRVRGHVQSLECLNSLTHSILAPQQPPSRIRT
jgi:hypothetical protein